MANVCNPHPFSHHSFFTRFRTTFSDMIIIRHCHIAWHVGGGLGVTFLERPSDFRAGVKQADVDVLNSQCDAWNNYYPTDIYKQYDSGV